MKVFSLIFISSLIFVIFSKSNYAYSQNKVEVKNYSVNEKCMNSYIQEPHSEWLNEKIDSIKYFKDSISFFITFWDECNFKGFKKVFRESVNDSLMLSYEGEYELYEVMCRCLFSTKLTIPKCNYGKIFWNNKSIEKTIRNYSFDTMLVERYKNGDIKRVIYAHDNNLMVEEKYEKNNILSEKIFYEKYSGIKLKEYKLR